MKTFELYGGEVMLTFDEKKHVYRVEGEKGLLNVTPSVTGITGIIDKSGPLMWWAVGCAVDWIRENLDDWDLEDEVAATTFWHDAKRAHFRKSKEATDIGTLAHKWIEEYLADWKPTMPKNPQLLSTIESWLDWAHENQILAYETEFKVYSREHDYAGTCDFDGIINGERCIADWKTGKAVYPEHRLQTIAYLLAREEELKDLYDARWVVVLPKDGGDIIAERIDPKDNAKHEAGFLGALALHKALKG
jgi:hypothetical protein